MAAADSEFENLPACATEYINSVVRRIRYSKKVRREVRRELIDHFSDTLGDGTDDQERQEQAEQLIRKFGDAKLLGSLICRGKKRCRPLWKKAIIRSLQFVFLCYLLVLPYNAWVMHTWNDTRVDYLKMFNDLNRPAAGEEENSLPYYQRAVELYVEMPDDLEKAIRACSGGSCRTTSVKYESLSEKDKAILRRWLRDNDQAWQQVKAATEVEYYWRQIHAFAPDGFKETTQFLSQFRRLARMGGRWRVQQQITDHNLSEAMEDCLTVARMGRHLMASKLLYEYLSGSAVSALASLEIRLIIEECSPDWQLLSHVQEKLEILSWDEFPIYDMQGEAIYFLGGTKNMIKQIGAKSYLVPL